MSKNKNSKKTDAGEIPTNPPAAPESQLPVPAIPAQNLALLFARAQHEGRKVTRYSLPPIVKPAQVPAGVGISGTIKDIIPSPVSAFKSDLLVLTHHTGQEFCFPLTAVVKRACLLRCGNKGEKAELTQANKQSLVGQEIEIVGLGQTMTRDGQRRVNLFEIGFVEKA
jgi:hypothetical protein